MSRSPEFGCKSLSPSPSPTVCLVTAASEYVDEASNLMVTTRSITSMDSSSFMSDEHEETSETSGPLMPQPFAKSDTLPGSTSPKAKPSSSPHDDSLDLISFHSPQITPQQTALHHETSPHPKDESISTASTDAGIDTDCRSSDLSGSFTDSCSKGKDAEVSTKPSINRFLSSAGRLGRLVPVEGSIGSFHEYVRPNAETSFLFSFTPITGTGQNHTQSSRNMLIGSLENICIDNIDKGPAAAAAAAAGQKSIKLRRRRCVDVRSLTFDDWRPGTDSQARNRRDEPSQAARKKSISDPTQPETESHRDTTTADRQRFDSLVSRLQQKLSERNQDRSSGSTNAPSIFEEVSRRSSHAGSAHSGKSSSNHIPESSPGSAHVDSKGSGSNHLLSAEDVAYAANENQGQPELEAPLHTQQQSAPGLYQPFPAQFQENPIPSADYLPQFFPSLMQQLPQYPGLWNGHSDPALSLEQPMHPTMAFHKAYPSPPLQPQMAAWPHAAGVPPPFGAFHYAGHPQEAAPCPPRPLPHHKPPRSPRKSKSRGHIPFVPLSATDQQRVEEHIEFMKATVPSFALVSKRRQRQRWLRDNSNRENQQRQQEELTKKNMQSYQPPVPLQPGNHWGPQAYPQLQQQYYHQYVPATASQAPIPGPPPLYNPTPFTNIPWSNLSNLPNL